MGVDNNGILFLGLKENDIDFTVLPDFDMAAYEDDSNYLIDWGANDKHYLFDIQEDNAYQPEFKLIGIQLANSGSYGCREVTDLLTKITDATANFEQWFKQSSKLFILNYQW